jgi:hypothetical protein
MTPFTPSRWTSSVRIVRNPKPASSIMSRAHRGALVHQRVVSEQALFARAPEERPVRVGSAEVRVPRVEVRVEVQQSHRTVLPVHRSEERQQHRVIPADAHDRASPLEHLVRASLDLADRLHDVEGVTRHVPRVGALEHRERLHLVDRMELRPEHPRCLADRVWAEPLPAGSSRRSRTGSRGSRRRNDRCRGAPAVARTSTHPPTSERPFR